MVYIASELDIGRGGKTTARTSRLSGVCPVSHMLLNYISFHQSHPFATPRSMHGFQHHLKSLCKHRISWIYTEVSANILSMWSIIRTSCFILFYCKICKQCCVCSCCKLPYKKNSIPFSQNGMTKQIQTELLIPITQWQGTGNDGSDAVAYVMLDSQ